MNRVQRLTLLAMFTSACSGSDGGTGPEENSGGNIKVLTARYNGASWTAPEPLGAWLGGQFLIAGGGAVGSINIAALDIDGPGSYALGPGNPNTAIAMWVDGTGQYSSIGMNGTGTLTLTRVSMSRLTGSFSFRATYRASGSAPLDTVNVTDGQFDISIP